jgi:hypothetical protein
VYSAYPNEPVLVRWQEIEPTFTPNVVARPLTASVLGYAAAWIKHNGPGVVWVQHDYVGSALAGMAGVPFFGAKGKDPTGRYIEDYSPEKSAVASIFACERGMNLQGWNRNLVLGPPPAATKWEQAICGRTHRQGQLKTVYVDVVLSCAENIVAIDKAIEEAGWVVKRGADHKLAMADWDWTHFPREELRALPLTHPSRARWVRPKMTLASEAA